MNPTPHGRGLALALASTLALSAVSSLASTAVAAPATLRLVATSQDGGAFDLDEYAPGDLTVQVTDPVAGAVDVDDAQDLRYFWTITPFDPAVPASQLPAVGMDLVTSDVVGEFVVPLPTTQTPGTYVLVAGLGPDAADAHAIPRSRILTLEVGNATIDLDDDSPLRTAAGADRPVAGSLRLENGTGLPGRLVDLALVRGAAGGDPLADAGFVPATPGPLVTSLQVPTDADGSFSAVLSDPPEDGQGSELGGTIDATTAATPAIGDADATSSLDVDLVSVAPPTGSTVVVDDLGSGTPGRPLVGKVTVTAPDDTFDVDPTASGVQGDADLLPDPVVGQLTTVELDHGFFTTGDEQLPSVVGAPAGTLEQLGRSLTGLTDADGAIDFKVAIGRDRDFDPDGQVTATVTTHAGALTGSETAEWDTSNPLNGRVEIVRSPAAEQVAPVDPALAGNRTYYEVDTLDQFGNRVVGKPVALTYSGDLDNYDYSDDFVVSDLDDAGDVWVVSFETGSIDLTGTWNAPTYRYTDTAGTAATGTDDAVGSSTADFYELDFDASRFKVTSDATDVVAVGSTVTQTVRVVDQEGNPVRGYRVQFFRFGPERSGGEARANRVTNARGEATYTFVGTRLGRAQLTAVVSDGVRSRTLDSTVVFGSVIRSTLVGTPEGGRAADVLTVRAPRMAAGARVRIVRVAHGVRRVVRVGVLDATGRVVVRVRDRNARRGTTYVAEVGSTPRTVADVSNTVRVR
ncbi:Ig-like domain-containing protein [Nocardioides rubriscoriae]|uniref:Ig-like domain-containing protein n=1 Tax=Nocardioides rubriscoriae TaxID=642762 RepID=UPI0011DF2939|nr:hypothetical protein [Nocardioides rubriscoriae]